LRPSSTAPWSEWTAACSFEIAAALGGGGVRARVRGPPRLHVPRRSALLYGHQYHYFTNGLLLAQHPSPLRYVLRSDEWRLWNGEWTIAPLYHLFLGVLFRLFGPHLLPLRLVQCALERAGGGGGGGAGRRAAGPRGAWAGVAYALWWPAVEMTSWTMTENLHTVLFVSALALMAKRRPSRRAAVLSAGIVLGWPRSPAPVSTGLLSHRRRVALVAGRARSRRPGGGRPIVLGARS